MSCPSGILDANPGNGAGVGKMDTPKPNGWSPDSKVLPDALDDGEQQIIEAGEAKYHRLGWKRLTIMLIIEAIGLGALSIPSAFASLGMVAGVICCVGIGLIAIYTSWIIGKVKLAFPGVRHYGDAGGLLMGRVGNELFTFMLILQLVFLTGSNCLTGTIAWRHITDSNNVCSVVFSVVSAIILLLLSIPSSFADMAWLGYIDFVSIVAAIGITIISTGIQGTQSGLSKVDWSALPQGDPSFSDAFIAISNIVFAYTFIVIYTVTGATIYAFVGQEVESPALLSAGSLVSKVAFGIALPVIFISGAIGTIVAGRLIHGRIYENSVTRYVNTTKGWITWLTLITILTILAWVIAEAVPFFDDLLSITSALFTSGFSFYLPPVMWFFLLRKGEWYSRENLLLSLVNLFVFIFGLVVLVGGLYSSIQDIRNNYRTGNVHSPFTCGAV
ncbi:hypothetical protein AO1008_04610 [Aspergillus oryzae 100-8]|nr:hypothetical protein AO1008_04610 [Aspergillus oryzae 100-8]